MSCTCESHDMHMCALKAEGKADLIKSLSDNPTVECRQCAAHLRDEAPNVEGGHGNVGIEEVGKPHAGSRP